MFFYFKSAPIHRKAFLMSAQNIENTDRHVTLYLIHTSDVHGNLFGYDYLKKRNLNGGLDCIASYVKQMRRSHPECVFLTDGGDFLQGQPHTYYYNYIRTDSPHIVAQAMNEMEYDCAVIGNHDIETGHEVYDRIAKEMTFPILGANVIRESTGKPYFCPYHVVERNGVRVAFLGLTSDAIPGWLPPQLWQGMHFERMKDSAKHWIAHIREHEKPHLIVGLFHSGLEGGMRTEAFEENVCKELVSEVDGLDLVLYGHDHSAGIVSHPVPSGNNVLMLNPSSFGLRVAVAEVKLHLSDDLVLHKHIHATLPKMSFFKHLDERLLETHFRKQVDEVAEWLDTRIGELTEDIRESDAYFGPSDFVGLMHRMQLEITGAQISFASPLNYDTVIPAGPLRIQDMFSLYKFENFLCVLKMTGREIRNFLELSYARWTNCMTDANDHVLLLAPNLDNGKRLGLMHLAYNFDSAYGIHYTVDVTKPNGKKIAILKTTDGTDFNEEEEYTVAMNSYRANGGGELMTLGAGIPHGELGARLVFSTDRDLRFHFIEYVRKYRVICPHNSQEWSFVPKEWTECALKRDRLLLFEEEKI